MQVCTCCGVACGKCLANEGLLEEATRFRRALERIHRGDQPAHKIAAEALTCIPEPTKDTRPVCDTPSEHGYACRCPNQ